MSVADVARCSEQIVKAKTIRNRAVERLGLNAPPPDPWLTVDSSTNGNCQVTRQ